MDRRVGPKAWIWTRLSILGSLLAVIACAAALLSYLSTPRLRVERDKVTIDTVRRGAFQEYLLPLGEVCAGSGGREVRASVDRDQAARLAIGQPGQAEIAGLRGA